MVLVEFAGTVTVAGTVTSGLLLERFAVKPPDGAAAFSVTVQLSVPAPVTEALVQAILLNNATAVPPCPDPPDPWTVSGFSVLTPPHPERAIDSRQEMRVNLGMSKWRLRVTRPPSAAQGGVTRALRPTECASHVATSRTDRGRAETPYISSPLGALA
jgi:hypothetical protein